MSRLPSIKRMRANIIPEGSPKAKIRGALTYLTSRGRVLAAKYGSVENMVLSEEPRDAKEREVFDRNFARISSRLAMELASHDIFIGRSVLEDLLFHSLVDDPKEDPVGSVLRLIRDSRLHEPGFVVYPLHSFGVLGFGFFQVVARVRPRFHVPDSDIMVSPQTNSWPETVRFLDAARRQLGVQSRLPSELLEHWRRSRPTRWLSSNPLLVLKTRSFPGSYYENQPEIVAKIQIWTALLFLMAALEPNQDHAGNDARLGSTSVINNFETFDFRHYLVFYPGPGKRHELDGDCVPMHLQTPELLLASDLSIDLDPRTWNRRHRMSRRLVQAVRTIQTGFFKSVYRRGPKLTVRGRIFRKIFRSLQHYHRSFRRGNDSDTAVLSLAIALETLLNDDASSDIKSVLQDRTFSLLRGMKGRRRLADSVHELYEARNEVVHAGGTSNRINLALPRAAYAASLLAITERLHALPQETNRPVADLCAADL